MMRVGLRLPAVRGDQVAVVLHGRGPVIHQVLIDVVAGDQRLVRVVGQQALAEADDQGLGGEAGLQRLERGRGAGCATRRTAPPCRP